MKIYIAHNYSMRETLKPVVKQLESYGHEITSKWIWDDTHNVNTSLTAIGDIEDLASADALLLFTDQPEGCRPGRGKYVEFGYAIATEKRIYLFGNTDDCVFYHLPGLICLDSLQDLKGAK